MTKHTKAALPVRENAAVYTDLFLMTLPLLAMAVYLYGPRSLTLYALAVLVANLCDRVVAVMRRRPFEPGELSNEAFAGMLAVLMPATVSYHVLIVAVLAMVLVGKEAFGGYGAYVFHPTAVGYALAAISWPEQVCRYPQPFSRPSVLMTELPAGLVESTSRTLRNNGIPNISDLNLLLGNYAGPMGAAAALIVLAVALYLSVRHRLPLAALAGYLGVFALVVWIAPRVGDIPPSFPWEYLPQRLEALKYELLSGSVLYAGVFFLCDPYTVPKNRLSRVCFGCLLGLLTVLFCYYGSYEASVCFAFLLVNCVSGWIERQTAAYQARRERKGAAA